MSLIASARLHRLDPEAYLRDLIRLVPHWPRDRYLELAPRYAILAPLATATESTKPHDLGPDAPSSGTLDPEAPRTSRLSMGPLRRANPRQKPSAVVPHARICARGGPSREAKARPYRNRYI
jgi:IS66 C-terminal element